MSSSETEDTLVALGVGKCISPPATLLFNFYLPVRARKGTVSTQMLVGERVMPENLFRREIVAGRHRIIEAGLTRAF
jgi:hypothetical protein